MTATEATIRAEHAAAAVMREAPSTKADVAALQAIKATEGAKNVFQREAVPADTEKKPNFPEINATLAKFNPPRPDLLATSASLQEIIEGRPPAAGGPDAHIKLIGSVAANMPGMVAAISKETGLTPAVVKARLRTNLTGLKPILRRLQQDEAFIGNLSKNVANIEYTEEMSDMDARLASLDNKITTTEADINKRKLEYTNAGAPPGTPPGAKEWWAGLPAADQASIRSDVPNMTRLYGQLNVPGLGTLQRSSIASAEIPAYKGNLDAELSGILPGLTYARLAGIGGAAPIDLNTEIKNAYGNMAGGARNWNERCDAQLARVNMLRNAYAATDQINAILAKPAYAGNFDDIQKKYQLYSEADEKLKGLRSEQTALDQDKAERDKLKLKRDRKLNEYGNKVASSLDRSFREYYNDVLLQEAQTIAELDANKKAEDKKKAEDLKQKRETDARELLSKYLRLSYLKYRGGKVVGWDDDTIKKFVKKDLLSSSPAQMGRTLLDRINSYKATLPPTYQAEINKTLADMGVTAGPPPVTFANVMSEMDPKFLASLAAEEMPKVLGYAYARGYYFDRLRMSKDQAEFVKTAYSPEFFMQALGSKEEYRKQFEAEFGKGVLKGEMGETIRQALVGKDWEDGMKKLLRVAAIGGLTVAGLDFLGGTAGVAGGINTLGLVGRAGADVVRTASQGVAYGVRSAAMGVSGVMADAAGFVNPLPQPPNPADMLVPEPPPVVPSPGGRA